MTATNNKENKWTAFWNFIGTQYTLLMKKCKMVPASRWLIFFVIVLFIALIFLGIENIVAYSTDASGQIYKAIGFGIIMVWTCIFICYFIWAVHFYSQNYGYSQKEWGKITAAKANRTQGKAYRQEDIDEEPKYNPYKDQTFGLPGGTVRGMIAFTLLFGSIALLIVSFGMNNEIQSNGFFIDQFDFFKKAFLMMIAFYFGNHSLKYLKQNQPVKLGGSETPSPQANREPEKPQIVVIEPSSNKEPDGNIKMPPIIAIDPMAAK